MMPEEIDNFFNAFGKAENGKTYPKNMSIESIAIDMAKHHEDTIEPRHGLFFDFSKAPELEKPVLDYLVKRFGWTLETPFFIRKPEKLL